MASSYKKTLLGQKTNSRIHKIQDFSVAWWTSSYHTAILATNTKFRKPRRFRSTTCLLMEGSSFIGVTTSTAVASTAVVPAFSGLRITGLSLLVGTLVIYTVLVSYATRWHNNKLKDLPVYTTTTTTTTAHKVVRKSTRPRESLWLRPQIATTSLLGPGPLHDIETLDSMLALPVDLPSSRHKSAGRLPSCSRGASDDDPEATTTSTTMLTLPNGDNADERVVRPAVAQREIPTTATTACRSLHNDQEEEDQQEDSTTAEVLPVDEVTRQRHTMTIGRLFSTNV